MFELQKLSAMPSAIALNDIENSIETEEKKMFGIHF